MEDKYTLTKANVYTVDGEGNEELIRSTFLIGVSMKYFGNEKITNDVNNITIMDPRLFGKNKIGNDIIIFDDKEDLEKYVKNNNIHIDTYWCGLTPDDFESIKDNSIGSFTI